MQEPNSDLTSESDESSAPPDFDALQPPKDLVRGDRTRDDFFDAVLGLDSPKPASEVADLAGHGVDAAREYLEWFEGMGIVIQVTESPATYKRNQKYLNWRRIQQLQQQYTPAQLVEFLKSESDRNETYAETFGVDSPNAVSVAAQATETGRSVEDVWEEVSTWKTIQRRIGLLEQALASAGDAVDHRTAV